MKRSLPLAALAVTLIIVAFAAGTTSDRGGSDDVSAQVRRLEKQVAAMQSRLEELERQFQQMLGARQSPTLIVPPGISEPRQAPPGSRGFEFNGRQFYICPLSRDPALPAMRTRQLRVRPGTE
jgi:hypothetical protein